MSKTALRDRLTAFYKKYNEEKVPDVEALMAEYDDQEDMLFALLTSKYGPEQSNYTSTNCPLKVLEVPEKHQRLFGKMFDGVLLHWFGVVQKNGASSMFGATSGRRIVALTDKALFLCKEDKGTVSRCLPVSKITKVTKITGTKASDLPEFVIHMAAPEFDLRFKMFDEDCFAYDEITEDEKFVRALKALYKVERKKTPNAAMDGSASPFAASVQQSPSLSPVGNDDRQPSPPNAADGPPPSSVDGDELPVETVKSTDGAADLKLERPSGYVLRLVRPTKLELAIAGL